MNQLRETYYKIKLYYRDKTNLLLKKLLLYKTKIYYLSDLLCLLVFGLLDSYIKL